MSVNNVAEDIIDKKYRIEKVAPEGAWGYLVGIGLTLPMVKQEFYLQLATVMTRYIRPAV